MKQSRSPMKLVLFLCSTALPFAQGAHLERANPIQKTVELLTTLQKTIISDGEKEATAYKKYFEWCDDAAHEKDFEIKDAKKLKAKLEANIAQLSGEIQEATSHVEELAASVSQMQGDVKDATEIRNKEHADFEASEKELLEALDMLERAIAILEREAKGTALIQTKQSDEDLQTVLFGLTTVVDAAGFASDKDQEKLAAFLQSSLGSQDGDSDADSDSDSDDDEEGQEPGAPAASVYENHSGGIVNLMQDLRDKAEAQLQSERQAEEKAQHSFELYKQSLEDAGANSDKELSEQKAQKASSTQAKAADEGELAVTVRELADAEAALKSIQEKCMEIASDHEVTVKGNEEQLKVLAEAKKLLQSTTGGAQSQVYSLLQTAATQKSASQIRGKQVLTILNKLAAKLRSTELSQFASRVSAVIRYGESSGEDPFMKVKGLIEALIARLEGEAAADAKEKAYCDKEMADTAKKEGELTDEVAGLKNKIETATTESTTLKSQVKDLQAEIAALEKLMQEETESRTAAHEAYVSMKQDLEQGLDGVRGATKMLSEYYSAADKDEALLQTGDSDSLSAMMEQPQAPVKFQKNTGAATSILGLLEVCENDLAKNLAQAETEESDEQANYEKSNQENKVTKTMKVKDVEYKTKEFKALDKKVADLSADLATSSEELAAVSDYFAKVKDRCVAKPEVYEERKAAREAEINGLKEAMAILQGPSSFLQKRRL